MSVKIVPVTLATAKAFVNEHHRHNKAPVSHKFSIGLADDDNRLVGVVIVGRPVARALDDGSTAEITRCCVTGEKNANSMLYGAAVRAAKAMGYCKIVTYTLPTESGASLKAAGFRLDGETTHSGGWDTPSRHRANTDYPVGKKLRWVRT